MSTDRDILEPQPTINPKSVDLHKPIEPIVKMPLRRSQRVRRLVFLDDYLYLHENVFNIGQVNDAKPFDEASYV